MNTALSEQPGSPFASKILYRFAEIGVSALFLAGVAAKLLDWDPYRKAVILSFPEFWRPPIVTLIVSGLVLGVELFIGVSLLRTRGRQVGLLVAFFLCLAFAGIVGPIYDRLGGSCGCAWRWMPIAPRNGLELIVADLALASLLLELYCRGRRRVRT